MDQVPAAVSVAAGIFDAVTQVNLETLFVTLGRVLFSF